ncbi:MAG: hypothetical protein ACP5IC_01390 [Minisyncoccia bacterium]
MKYKPENKNLSPNNDLIQKETKQDKKIEYQFEKIIFYTVTSSLQKKLGIFEKNNQTMTEYSPIAFNLASFKTNIVDSLYQLGWIKKYKNNNQENNDEQNYIFREQLKDFLRGTLLKRYKYFCFPGNIQYNIKTNQRFLSEPKNSLNYKMQKFLLEKSGFNVNNIKFFEPQNENSINPEIKKDGWKIFINDQEKTELSKNNKYPNTTNILFESLNKLGFFDNLPKQEKNKIFAGVIFSNILESGEWLKYATQNYFNKNKINLFHINRLLEPEKILTILQDYIKPLTLDFNNFFETQEKIKNQIIKMGTIPFSESDIKKYNLEKEINNQTNIINQSIEFLQQNNNKYFSNIGKIIYIKANIIFWQNKLQGQLPALAAQPLVDKNNKPLWEQPNAYIEISKRGILIFAKNNFTDKIINSIKTINNTNILINPIYNWTKIFIPESENNNKVEKQLISFLQLHK